MCPLIFPNSSHKLHRNWLFWSKSCYSLGGLAGCKPWSKLSKEDLSGDERRPSLSWRVRTSPKTASQGSACPEVFTQPFATIFYHFWCGCHHFLIFFGIQTFSGFPANFQGTFSLVGASIWEWPSQRLFGPLILLKRWWTCSNSPQASKARSNQAAQTSLAKQFRRWRSLKAMR